MGTIDKTFLMSLILVIALVGMNFCLAQEATVVKSTKEASQSIFHQAANILSPMGQKIKAVWLKYLEPYFGKYLVQIKENIKQGIAEERGEMSSDFKGLISKAWNFLLHLTKKNAT